MATRSLQTIAVVLAAAAVLGACGGGSGDEGRTTTAGTTASTAEPTGSEVAPKVELVDVGRFDEPVHAVPVPGTDLVAVVEKGGRVRVVAGMVCAAPDNCPAKPVTKGKVVLDVADSVSSGSEQGLLGFAFHPDWPNDPRVFVDYTDTEGATHVEAWSLGSPTGKATRERELLRIEQPYENHNGGHLAFGPDGLLYIGTGDGGSAGDPEDRAQKPDELLGKLLRIDVDGGGERGYAVPDGNLAGGAAEVWALGLRNPWRFSFDARTGDLWIGDVGQDSHEEVDAVPRAALDAAEPPNFGWRLREGFDAFDDSGTTGPGKLTGPVLDYGRDDGCSVTGGVVYRGKMNPDLVGWYVFADFCERDLRLVRAEGVPGSTPKRGDVTWTSRPGAAQVASFAEVQRGELLVVSLDGTIRQVVVR